MPLIGKYVWLQVRKQCCKLTVWIQSVRLRQQTSHKRQNYTEFCRSETAMIFNSHFEYDVIETFVRGHEELVYSMCSRTRSPRLWDVNCGNGWFSSSRDRKGQSYPVEYYLELVEEYSKGKIHKSEPEPGNGNVNTVYFVHQARGNTRVCLQWTSTRLQMITYIWASCLE